MDTLLQQLSELLASAVDFIPRLMAALVVFLLSVILARLAGSAVVRTARNVDEEVRRLLGRLTSVAVIVVGTIAALDQVNFDVTGFVAGLGIVGFTLGFAFQDIAKNFMAGILLLMEQPFQIGDAIKVAGHEGTVTDVDIRATTLKAWDGPQVVIPNADVYTNAITNYSKYPDRRIILGVGVGYEEDLARAHEVFLAAIQSVDEVLPDPAPAIYWRNLGSSAVDMEAFFWIDQTKLGLAEVTSKAVRALKEAAEREGINLPYPIQTVRVHQMTDAEPL